MNIRKWEAFVRSVELGSLSRAAEELGYTQSGISHMMQSLEQEVGFSLLSRTVSGIRPNSEGELLLPAVRQLLSANESLAQYIARVRGADTGRIRIAAYPSVATYWLPSILREYQRDFPHVEVQITETGSGAIEAQMAERQVELCLYAGGEGKDFDWIPLRADRLLVLLPPGHPLAARESFPLSALMEQEFIMPMPDYDGEVRFVLNKLPHWPHIRFSACSDYAIMNMVAAGLGVSVLPELLLQNHPHHTAARPLDPPQERTLGIGVPHRETASPVTQNFIRYAERFVNALGKSCERASV